MADFGAPEYVRLFDGLARMNVQPSEEFVAEFFRSSANKIVRTSERVRHTLPAVDAVVVCIHIVYGILHCCAHKAAGTYCRIRTHTHDTYHAATAACRMSLQQSSVSVAAWAWPPQQTGWPSSVMQQWTG